MAKKYDELDELDFILNRVWRTEDAQADYRTRIESAERMYKGDAGFNRTLHEAVAEGQEQIIIPVPFNVINLSMRLLSSKPKIDVIPYDPAERQSVEYAENCERWLNAMWRQIAREQRRNVLTDLTIHTLLRGRPVLYVRWIKDNLPKARQKNTFPILISALNPKHVGGHMGPYGPEFAYNIEEEPILDVLRRWPDLADAEKDSKIWVKMQELEDNNGRTEDITVCTIDYWAMNPDDGSIWNAVIVEDELAKPYAKSSYPDIPIIIGRADYAPGLGDEYDGMSILQPIDGLWQYQCRLASQMATGVAWDYWPHIGIKNENNAAVDDLVVGPGITSNLPAGVSIEVTRLQPNHQLAREVHDQVDRYIQQSTYSSVVYGEIPDSQLSGWGVSMLSDNTKGRIKEPQEGIELVLSHANSLVLAMVEKKGGKKGVGVYGVNTADNEKYRLTLTPEMINGNYENLVRITPNVPSDSLARGAQGVRYVEGHLISDQTFRDQFMDIEVPSDETARITLEELMKSDELRPYRLQKAAERWFGDEALDVLVDTPLMVAAPEGMIWIKDEQGRAVLRPATPMGQGGETHMMPDGTMMDGPPMMDNMASGMPPGGGMLGAGLVAPNGGVGAVPNPLPIQTPLASSIQPPGIFSGPMGGGIPPVAQGQLEGESLGLNPQLNPLDFATIMGQQLPPQEELDLMAGVPPEGLNYGY